MRGLSCSVSHPQLAAIIMVRCAHAEKAVEAVAISTSSNDGQEFNCSIEGRFIQNDGRGAGSVAGLLTSRSVIDRQKVRQNRFGRITGLGKILSGSK